MENDLLNLSKGAGQAEGLPLTHQAYMNACQRQAQQNPPDPRPWVQVRRWHSTGAFTLCGQITALQVRDAELFVVATDIGEVMATGRNVRLCSGDSRCTCQADSNRGGNMLSRRCSTAGFPVENQGDQRFSMVSRRGIGSMARQGTAHG